MLGGFVLRSSEWRAAMAEASDLPDGVTKELIFSSVDNMLKTTSWDDITLKQVMATLEGQLSAELEVGWLKPWKKLVKEAVDAGMKAIMAAGGLAAVSAPAPAPEPEAKPEPEPEPEPPKKKRKKVQQEPDSDPEPEPQAKREAEPEPEDEDEEVAEDALGGDDDDDDEEYDVKVEGKGTRGKGEDEGKIFYKSLMKNDEEISVGQDVYLENGEDTPYVARLQSIFVYAMAPKEIYFNANWCAAPDRQSGRCSTSRARGRPLRRCLHPHQAGRSSPQPLLTRTPHIA